MSDPDANHLRPNHHHHRARVLCPDCGREKTTEYRQIKPYWTKRLEKISQPFELRLRNGMTPPVPEVTVLIHRVTKDHCAGRYRLHIAKVLRAEHWDRRLHKPKP